MATLAEARLKACKLWPYGSHSILSLVPVESQQVDRACVDQYCAKHQEEDKCHME